MTFLRVENLRIDIATQSGTLHAVRGVDLELAQGEVLGIVGESGCGKSLTAMGLLGLLPKSARRTADRIDFLDRDLAAARPADLRKIRGNRIGMIFQDPMTTLNPAYTIGNQLVEGYMQHRRASRREAVDRAVFLLNRTGITAARSRLSQYPHQLSGGLRQRIVIAMALMCEPDLIIADEPTTALDVTVQAQILLLIKDIQAEMHAGVIIITHDLGVVAQMADRVAVMYAGDVVETGPTAAIFAQPKHPYTIGLLSCMPDVGRGARLGQIPGVVPSLVGDVQGCAFRTRCSAATGACRGDIPVRRHDDGHRWNCTRPVEGAWVEDA